MARTVVPASSPSTPPAWHVGRSLAAAAWPLGCALGFAAYAFFPERFPPDTDRTLGWLVAAELPALMIGLLHAAALTEPTARQRVQAFLVSVALLAAITVLNLKFDVDLLTAAPMVAWICVPYAIDLAFARLADPQLASRQAEAAIQDRLHLISLTPVIVIGALVLAIAATVLLMVLSIALEGDFTGPVSKAIKQADPSLLALIGSAYLLVAAASAAHVHRPVFLQTRRRLLDRPWINRITLTPSSRLKEKW